MTGHERVSLSLVLPATEFSDREAFSDGTIGKDR